MEHATKSSAKVSLVGLFAVITFVLTFPVVLLLSQQKQDVRSKAAESFPTPTAMVPLTITPFALSGYVYYDTNKNGVRDSGEQPYQGAMLKLYHTTATNEAKVEVTTVTTDTGGFFTYNLTTPEGPGNYILKLLLPDGYKTINTNPVIFAGYSDQAKEIKEFGLFPISPSRVVPTLSQKPQVTCVPRPACLNSTPRCLIAEPAGGWCPKSAKGD